MKIAVTGKGGSGKTTVTAGLSLLFARSKKPVIAIDCDPDMNLGYALGFPHPEKISPISTMKSLIAERTESNADSAGGYFKLNPKVDDIPEKFCPEHNNIRLIVMGKIRKAEGGCLCPENTFIKQLVSHLIISKEIVLMDMVAGTEHLGRGTAGAVDAFIVVAEPTQMGVNTGAHIQSLAKELGIKNIFFVGNKINSQEDTDFLAKNIPGEIIGSLSFNTNLLSSRGRFSFDDRLNNEFQRIFDEINRRVR